MKSGVFRWALCALGLANASMVWAGNPADTQMSLRIIATTDVHSFLTDFDYYKDQPAPKFGLTRAASLIEQARQEVKNSVLVDNGDLIQGNPIADYQIAKGDKSGAIHPAILALNTMGYDVATLGNHEFNYGLPYLDRTLARAKFPVISSNIVKAGTQQPRFKPYWIQTKNMVDKQGVRHTIKIGYIGFVPPQIMVWDKGHLKGKLDVSDIKQTAEKYVPILKKQGADVIVALAHSGAVGGVYQEGQENAALHLSEVKGIDALVFGHAHRVFPSKDFSSLSGADVNKGTIQGVPASEAGNWGSHISVIDLDLKQQNGKWQVSSGTGAVRPIYDNEKQKSTVENHPQLTRLLAQVHEQTRTFIAQPIGKSAEDMYSFLALIQPDPTVQIVNQAQKSYVEKLAQKIPNLAGIPVLSAAAPFKVGGRKNDPSGYVEVNKGDLTLRSSADLYLYPNTLAVVKVNGTQLKEWLECSAGMFNRIKPDSAAPQSLFNWEGFRTYNFDVIDGVNYQIDVTQPARYDGECKQINPDARRIVGLTYNGKPVDPNASFLIATNNYRANGGKFAGTGDAHIVFASPDENRQVLTDYIIEQSQKNGEIKPLAERNWRIAPITSSVPLDVRFETAPSEKAKQFISKQAQYPVRYLEQDATGFAVYQLDLKPQAK